MYNKRPQISRQLINDATECEKLAILSICIKALPFSVQHMYVKRAMRKAYFKLLIDWR